MEEGDHTDAAGRLARLKGSPDCIAYFVNLDLDPRRNLRLSLYGAYPTAEIYVELTDGQTTRVRSFRSRMQSLAPELRKEDMLLVDQADAFVLARRLSGRWSRSKKTENKP